MAVGLAVALVALGRLRHRADVAADLPRRLAARPRPRGGRACTTRRSCTSQRDPAVGARRGRRPHRLRRPPNGHAITTNKGTPRSPLGQPELAVANGEQRPERAHGRRRTARDYRVVAVPAGEQGFALVLAQSLAPQERVLKRLGAGDAALRPGRRDRRGRRRLGRGAQRAAAGTPAHPRRRGHRPHRGPRTRCRSRATTRSPGWRRRSTTMLAALSASRDRQRRLVADAGHELRTPLTSLRTNLDLLAPGRRGRRARRPARAPSCSTTYARQIEEMSTLVGDLVELARDEPLRPVRRAGRPRRGRRPGRRPGPPPRHRPDLRRRHRAVVGDRRVRRRSSARSPTCSTTPRSGARPAAPSRSGSTTGRSPSTTRARASPRPTATTSSSASTGPRSRARCRAPASACRSSARSSSATRGNVRVDETDQGGTRMVLQVPGAPLLVT